MKDAKEQEIILMFDNEEVPMVPFVENVVKGSILGMVQALKGYEEGKEIIIKIK